jgi:hypothetical protein
MGTPPRAPRIKGPLAPIDGVGDVSLASLELDGQSLSDVSFKGQRGERVQADTARLSRVRAPNKSIDSHTLGRSLRRRV